MQFQIICIAKKLTESLDYDAYVIKIRAADVFDADGSDDVWLFIKTIAEGGAKKLIIDMDALEFIDSYGIGVLINAAKLLRSKQGDIALLNVASKIEIIFRPVKLDRFIKTFSTEADALNFFRYV